MKANDQLGGSVALAPLNMNNSRVARIIRWVVENAERVERPEKGELSFHFGGRHLTVELREHEQVEVTN